MASSSSAAASTTPPSPPPIPVAKKPFYRRLAPIFFATNILVAIYVFVQTSRKQSAEKEAEPAAAVIPSAPIVSEEATIPEKKFYVENALPVKARPPVPEHEQRELLKWILEEKRKVKPKDPLEKKKIDEEKALLKQLIRAKSIPSL